MRRVTTGLISAEPISRDIQAFEDVILGNNVCIPCYGGVDLGHFRVSQCDRFRPHDPRRHDHCSPFVGIGDDSTQVVGHH